jgi:hypothetical protein
MGLRDVVARFFRADDGSADGTEAGAGAGVGATLTADGRTWTDDVVAATADVDATAVVRAEVADGVVDSTTAVASEGTSAGATSGTGRASPPRRFADEAAAFVEAWRGREGCQAPGLDFTPASLRRLDALVGEQWDEQRFRAVDAEREATAEAGGGRGGGRPPVRGGDVVDADGDRLADRCIALQLGSYVGETLVRSYEGTGWVEHDALGWVVAVDGPDASLVATVFRDAGQRLRGSSTVVAAHDGVVRQTGVGDPLDPVDTTVAAAINVPGESVTPEDLTAMAEHLRADYPWYDLSYTVETLGELDELVRGELSDRASLGDADDAELSERVRKLGAYFGETLVREADGTWGREGTEWRVDVDGDRIDVFRAALTSMDGGTTFTQVARRVLATNGLPEPAAAAAGTDGDVSGNSAAGRSRRDGDSPTSASERGRGVETAAVRTDRTSEPQGAEAASASEGDAAGSVTDDAASVARLDNRPTEPDAGPADEPTAVGDGWSSGTPADRAAADWFGGTDLADPQPEAGDPSRVPATPTDATAVDLSDAAAVEQWAAVLPDEFPAHELDGSLASVATVDALIEGPLPGADELAADDLADLTRAIGCYVGETVRTAHGGQWVCRDGDWSVVVPIADGEHREVDAFGAARRSLEAGEGRLAASTVDGVAAGADEP